MLFSQERPWPIRTYSFVQTFSEASPTCTGSTTMSNLSIKPGQIQITIRKNSSNLSPGNLFKHYSPNKSIRINVKRVLKNEGLLNFGINNLKSNIIELNLSLSGNLAEAGKKFYDYLHVLDNAKCKSIAVAPIPYINLGKTLNDRLKRASY